MISPYVLGALIGYYMVMMILIVIAILMAKRKPVAWAIYSVAVVLQLLSLIGNMRHAAVIGIGTPPIYWIVFLLLAAIGAMGISMRGRRS